MIMLPRYHVEGRWTLERGEDISAAARTLAWFLGIGKHPDEWGDVGRLLQPRRLVPRGEPGRFSSSPSKAIAKDARAQGMATLSKSQPEIEEDGNRPRVTVSWT